MKWASLGLFLAACSAPADDDLSPDPEPVCGTSMFRGAPQRAGPADGPLPLLEPSVQ